MVSRFLGLALSACADDLSLFVRDGDSIAAYLRPYTAYSALSDSRLASVSVFQGTRHRVNSRVYVCLPRPIRSCGILCADTMSKLLSLRHSAERSDRRRVTRAPLSDVLLRTCSTPVRSANSGPPQPDRNDTSSVFDVGEHVSTRDL